MKAAIDLRQQKTGDAHLAILDLEREMASGKLRSMRRHVATGESEFVLAPFWKTHFVGYSTIWHFTDTDRHRTDEYGNLVADRLDDWAFYVWQPHFDAIWSRPSEPLRPIDRAEAVLRALYRTRAEMPHRLKVATNAVDAKCRERGWQPVSSTDTVHRAAVKLGYRDPRKGE